MGAQCGPLNAVLTSGLPAGPIHPQVGDLVATKRGPRPISLEGFSEDDNQGLCRPYRTCRTCCLLCTCRSYCTCLSCTCTCDLYHHLHHPVVHPYGLHPYGLPLAVAAPAEAKAEEPAAVVDA